MNHHLTSIRLDANANRDGIAWVIRLRPALRRPVTTDGVAAAVERRGRVRQLELSTRGP